METFVGLEGCERTAPVLRSLREATGDLHQRLEQRFDAVSELADPSKRPATIARYDAFYSSAHASLSPTLESVEGLDFPTRSRAWQSARPRLAGEQSVFPQPADECEALGLCYVVEGSTLGGRLILRQLRARGIADPDLLFLDPYGQAGGPMWRSLLAVLEREGSRGPAHLDSMCRGAVRGFAHAERTLCGALA